VTGAEAQVLVRVLGGVAAAPTGIWLIRRMQRKDALKAEATGARFGCRATVRVRQLRSAGLLVSRHPRLSSALSSIFGGELSFGRLRITDDALLFLVPGEGRRVGIGDVSIPWRDVTSVEFEDQLSRAVTPALSLRAASLRVRLRQGGSVVFEGVPTDETLVALSGVGVAIDRDAAAPVSD
jgi:hypothetical protein